MEFEEWLRGRAPESVEGYMRYYSRFRRELEGLRIAGLPCNSWVEKLAGLWLDYLLFRGRLDVDSYSRKKVELQVYRRACRAARHRPGGRGLRRCPAAPRLPDGRTRWRSIALLALESGVRAKHLWRAAREGLEPDVVSGYALLDLREDYGYKRVNIVVARYYTLRSAFRALREVSYDSLRQAYARHGWTGLGCYRKYHWNLCLEASGGDRLLCGFIQGRWRPVEIGHYEDYKRSAVALLEAMLPGVDALAKGASLERALGLLKDQPPPGRVKGDPNPVPGPQAEGPGEPLRDSDPEALASLALIRRYSDLLG